jgi:hypothetical protein
VSGRTSRNRGVYWLIAAGILYSLMIASVFTSTLHGFKNLELVFLSRPDTILNTSILQWNLDYINHTSDLGITEAPIFFPSPHAKFYSEHLFGEMVYAWPLSLLIGSPFLLYTVVYMLGLLTAGLATFLLCRELTSSSLVGLAAGGLFLASVAFGQLQNTSFGWAILVIFFLVRHFERQRWSDVLGLTVCSVLTGLGSGYFAVYTPIAVLVLLVTKSVYSHSLPNGRWFLQMGIVVVLVSLALLPTMLVYKEVHDDLGLKRTTVRHLTYTLPSVGQEKSGAVPDRNVKPLSVTVLAQILFVTCAVLISLRRRRMDSWVPSLLVLAILSFWMASSGLSPYLLLRKIPVFDALRAVFRWFFFFAISLVTLVAVLGRRYLKKPVVASVVLAVAFCTMLHNRSEIADLVPDDPAGKRLPEAQVYDYLKDLPQGAILSLPIPQLALLSPPVFANRMLFQLRHRHRMVMGYSGFVPGLSQKIRDYLIKEGVSESSIQKLAATGIRYLVVDRFAGDTTELCGRVRRLQSVKILYDSNGQMVVELPRLEVERDLSHLYETLAFPSR